MHVRPALALVALAVVPPGCADKEPRAVVRKADKTAVVPPGRANKQPRAVVRKTDKTWEPIFFKSINQRTESSGLKPLRESVLPDGSCEIRLWAGFGLQPFPRGGHPLEGIVLRKLNDRYSGVHFPRSPKRHSLKPPSGWPEFWGRLESAGIYDLPDASGLDGYKPVPDGISYVVEVKRDGEYFTYMYGNPALQDMPEATQFLGILSILKDETGFGAGL